MNRILLDKDEVSPDGIAQLDDARAVHIINVLKSNPGDDVKTGIIDGAAGFSTILDIEPDKTIVRLKCSHTKAPLANWCNMILAMPRPKVMKRLWAQLSAMGVKHIALINAFKVEKYYFDSHVISEDFYRPLLIEGLQQSGGTRLPEISIHRSFKYFIEHELDDLFDSPNRFLAHPTPENQTLSALLPDTGIPTIAIGPEGGWTDLETKMFFDKSFAPFSMGRRILRTDTACIAALSRLGASFDRN